MISLGVILLIVGILAKIPVLVTIGVVLIVVGVVVALLGAAGRGVGSRKHYY